MSGISRRGYAKVRGLSEASIRKHIAQGTLAGAVLPDGTIDADKADRLLQGALTRPKATKAPPVLRLAKTRHLRAVIRRQGDVLAELLRSVVPPHEWEEIGTEADAVVITVLRRLPATTAPSVAGKPAATVLRLMDDFVNDALADIHDAFAARLAEDEMEDKPPAELDLDGLTPVQLNALKVSQTATMLEVQRAIARGELLLTDEVIMEDEERGAVAKSLLLAVPGRTATALEFASVEEAEVIIAREVEGVVAALAGNRPPQSPRGGQVGDSPTQPPLAG